MLTDKAGASSAAVWAVASQDPAAASQDLPYTHRFQKTFRFCAAGVEPAADFDVMGAAVWTADFGAADADWPTPRPYVIYSVPEISRPVTGLVTDGCWKIPGCLPGSFHRLCSLLYCFPLFCRFPRLLLFPSYLLLL